MDIDPYHALQCGCICIPHVSHMYPTCVAHVSHMGKVLSCCICDSFRCDVRVNSGHVSFTVAIVNQLLLRPLTVYEATSVACSMYIPNWLTSTLHILNSLFF